MVARRSSILLVLVACAAAPRAPANTPSAPPQASDGAAAAGGACDVRQAEILREADARAAPWSTAQHLATHFADGKVAWLMKEASYQRFIVAAGAKKWGRCDPTGCYVFVAPAEVIRGAVARSMIDGHHDPAALGAALGLPAANFEGPLRAMTLPLAASGACARLPVERDPGVWACKTEADTDCFKFGGFTSGGVPELIVIDAPVDRTAIEVVP